MSSFTQIVNQGFDAQNITGNGVFDIFESAKISAPNDYSAADNSLEVVVCYSSNLPDPDVMVAKYNLSCLIETEDDNGNWHPIHNQFRPYIKFEDGAKHIIRMQPDALLLDPGVPVDLYSGNITIAAESIKQGTLPDDFRVKIQCNEFGYVDGEPGPSSFQSVTCSVSYRTY